MIIDADVERLAELARLEAERHPGRTPGRRAAAALWVALITTRSADAAIRALPGFTTVETGHAAVRLLHRLAAAEQES